MKLIAALALLIQAANPSLAPSRSQDYSQALVQFAEQEGVDPLLVESVIFHESRWRSSAFRKENNGSCSVGLGQINIPGCDPTKIALLKNPLTNIRRVVRHLSLCREVCPKARKPKKCVHHGWVGLYNPGDPTYVARIMRRVNDHAARLDLR